jgi:hypothetical protein
MPIGITDLAHSLRKNTANSTGPIQLSLGQQLICAALGHKSLASFQAAQTAEIEPQSLDGLPHVVPDYELLTTRAAELRLSSLSGKELQTLLDTAFKERLPDTHLHSTFFDMAMNIHEEIQQVVNSDDKINSAIANANYNGVHRVYLEDEPAPDQATVDEPLKATIPGHVNLAIDSERPYSGPQMRFEVEVTLTRCGRRCFENAKIEVISAKLDRDWRDDEPPIRTLAEALAEELNIDVVEAAELTDVEPTELSGHSGEMTYGYLLDFTDRVSPELAARLMAQHGSLQLEVGPLFYEGVRGPDWPN